MISIPNGEYLLVRACLDYTLMDFSRLDSSRLGYRHLDYFGLKGHLDYKDIYWSISSFLGIFEPFYANLFICLEFARSF